MANADGSTNVRINKQRYEKLKRARLEVMVSGRDEIRISELVGYLIDNFLSDSIRDLKHRNKKVSP